MKFLFVVPFLFAAALADDSGLGCYSSVDTSVSKGYDKYQTLSLCASSCGDSYPYVAVKDGGYCYCLLSLPSDETDSSSCDVKCNGYGSVMCGGASAYTVFTGLGEVSGGSLIAGGSSGSSSSSSTSSLKAATTSSLASSTSSTSSSSSSSGPMTTSSKASVTSTSDSSLDGVSTYTSTSSDANGSVIYKTVTSQASPTASSDSKSSGSKKSTNAGAIAGGVVGGLAALALIGVAIFFFLRRRNAGDDDDEEDFYEKGSGSLNRGAGTGKSKKGNKVNPAFDMPMSNPFAHPTDDFADKRMSKMTQSELTDPRLNPAMMGRRRLSEGSLADETDYSRKILGVANP